LLIFATMTDCKKCFNVSLPACVSKIVINADLQANALYKALLRDKFDNAYQTIITADADGQLTIDTSVFSQGLFTPFSGPFNLSLYKCSSNDDCECEPEAITFCKDEFECITITFYQLYPQPETAEIRCC
jgi:hypothetical protein